jgi:hypothetical protein
MAACQFWSPEAVGDSVDRKLLVRSNEEVGVVKKLILVPRQVIGKTGQIVWRGKVVIKAVACVQHGFGRSGVCQSDTQLNISVIRDAQATPVLRSRTDSHNGRCIIARISPNQFVTVLVTGNKFLVLFKLFLGDKSLFHGCPPGIRTPIC